MKINHLLSLGLLLILGFTTSCNKKFNKLVKNGTVDQKYVAAMKYYSEADYYHAGLLLDEITPLLKGDSTSERAQFYNAYCNYYQSQYQMSSYLFKNFYATYNNSPFAEESFYMYAYSMFKDSPIYNLDQTSTITAIDALQTFINTYPDSKYAPACTQDLKDLRFRLEKKAYEKAKLYFKTREASVNGLSNYLSTVIAVENFRKDFPDSKFNEELQYLAIISQYEYAGFSFLNKQKDRYLKAISFYEGFIDQYPKSTLLKELTKIYDKAQSELLSVEKQLKDIEEATKKAEIERVESQTSKESAKKEKKSK
jgi:outer membrane protein assembly factor BamD